MEHDKLKEIFNRYKHNYLLDGHKTSTPLMDFNNFKYAAWCIENSSQLEPPVIKKIAEDMVILLDEYNINGMLQPSIIDKTLKIFGQKPYYYNEDGE